MDIKKLLPGVKKNIFLKNFTTFRIGGPAKYFYIAKTKTELIKVIEVAKKFKIPFFILGKGSNVLVSDKGFRGLMINFQFSIFNFQKNRIIVGAGLSLGKLVSTAVEKGLTGLEWVVGIPGTVGGAIYGNCGAFGKSMGNIVKEVEVYDLDNGNIKILENRDCNFDYRESIFKRNKNLIVLSAEIQLEKPTVRTQGKKSEIKNKIKEYLDYRERTQPLNFPSAGSVFKNFTPYRNEVSGAGPKKLFREFPELEKFKKTRAIPAAYLIEKCGLKGKKIGKAQISEKHANFIVNLGDAKAKDVKRLINLVKEKVKNKFGVELKEEIQYIGFRKIKIKK